jgi:general secretion pathway protein K
MTLRSSTVAVDYRTSGFALIIVLWTLILISLIFAQVTANGRSEIQIAGNLVANAVAQAAADGAVYKAIFNLSDPQPEQRWPVDGKLRELMIGRSRVTLQLEDEAWRINPNLASRALLEALLRVTGSAPESARRLAIAISDWVGSAPFSPPPSVLVTEYSEAGLDYRPPAAPLERLNELGRVLGMTPAILAAIRPHITLFGPSWPSLDTPDPIVAAAVAKISQPDPAGSPNQPPPDVLTVRITATAFGPNNAQVTRSTIVRSGAMLPGGYEILVWNYGS